jgi:hypothetical protein
LAEVKELILVEHLEQMAVVVEAVEMMVQEPGLVD